MKIKISQIKIGARFRKEPGDLDELATSIKEYGLLSPIVVRPMDNNFYKLLAGWRRLQAHKMLESTSIEVKIIKKN